MGAPFFHGGLERVPRRLHCFAEDRVSRRRDFVRSVLARLSRIVLVVGGDVEHEAVEQAV